LAISQILLGLLFFITTGEIAKMRKEFTIGVELDKRLEIALNSLRWKHINIEALLEEELREHIESVIRAYGEGE